MFVACAILINSLYVYYAHRMGGYTKMSICTRPQYYPLDHISVGLLPY
jgi:hypothetical protein